jgi:argininosuccinate synthase
MLIDRIGEQKIILNDLLLLIRPYCNSGSEFTSICEDFQNLKDKYREIKITFTQGDPVSVEKDGGLVITQTEKSIVEMSDEQLKGIIEITKKIRNRLISNN